MAVLDRVVGLADARQSSRDGIACQQVRPERLADSLAAAAIDEFSGPRTRKSRNGFAGDRGEAGKRLLHVALLIETSREYARGLLRGVARYLQEHTRWSVYFEPHGLDSPPPKWLSGWQGDGILVRINDRRMADAILKSGLPAVDLRGVIPNLGIPFMGVDNVPVVRLGFDHLHSCGLRHFAFCGTPRGEVPNQDFRCDYFVQIVREAGYDCSVYCGESGARQKPSWEQQQQGIVTWLKALPMPVGIMTLPRRPRASRCWTRAVAPDWRCPTRSRCWASITIRICATCATRRCRASTSTRRASGTRRLCCWTR